MITMEKAAVVEKRRGKRYPLLKPFEFTCNSRSLNRVLKGFILDMSYTSGLGVAGIGVHVYEKLEPGEDIEIRSSHAGSNSSTSARATVRWVLPMEDTTYRAGLLFAR